MKTFDNSEPVKVVMQGKKIVQLVMNGKTVPVYGIASAWIARGKWWHIDRKRHYVRLLTAGGTVDVYREGSTWFLARVMD